MKIGYDRDALSKGAAGMGKAGEAVMANRRGKVLVQAGTGSGHGRLAEVLNGLDALVGGERIHLVRALGEFQGGLGATEHRVFDTERTNTVAPG